ncbi:hypothetical protein WH47_08084, partial [Habropoda laboriosa]
YMDKSLRTAVTSALIEKCKEINSCSKNIHNMRCSFRTNLKNILKSKSSGISADNL